MNQELEKKSFFEERVGIRREEDQRYRDLNISDRSRRFIEVMDEVRLLLDRLKMGFFGVEKTQKYFNDMFSKALHLVNFEKEFLADRQANKQDEVNLFLDKYHPEEILITISSVLLRMEALGLDVSLQCSRTNITVDMWFPKLLESSFFEKVRTRIKTHFMPLVLKAFNEKNLNGVKLESVLYDVIDVFQKCREWGIEDTSAFGKKVEKKLIIIEREHGSDERVKAYIAWIRGMYL